MFQQLKSWGDEGGLSEGGWPKLKAAIEFHEAFGSDRGTDDMVHPHQFEDVWLYDLEDVPGHFSNPAQYQAWRNILISALEAYSGLISRQSANQEEAKDDWLRLRDWCRERDFGYVHENNLLALRRVALRLDTTLTEVTQDWAEDVQKGLEQSHRAAFRAGVGAFERARAVPEIRRKFGLPETPIGQLQRKPSPNEKCPLPPRLRAAFEEWIGLLAAGEPVGFRGRRRKSVAEATLRQYRFAIAWYWRAFAYAFPEQSDPDPAVLADQQVLEETSRIADETNGLQLKPGIKKEYLGKIQPFLHRWNPRLVQPEVGKKEINEG
ncbi:hypothetical protein [Leisingera aquimarina]|uniref:hypothetical protein n=1 Tax=Leisingera aquimarina TaxID=476529 RepID=UPI00048017DB|nr:hypothetical protein [Leisingera aquimarina]